MKTYILVYFGVSFMVFCVLFCLLMLAMNTLKPRDKFSINQICCLILMSLLLGMFEILGPNISWVQIIIGIVILAIIALFNKSINKAVYG